MFLYIFITYNSVKLKVLLYPVAITHNAPVLFKITETEILVKGKIMKQLTETEIITESETLKWK